MNTIVKEATQSIKSITFAVAELGAMKSTVDSLAYCRNKTEQSKVSKLVISFLSQMNRVRGGKALTGIKLVGVFTNYLVEEDDLMYRFDYFEE